MNKNFLLVVFTLLLSFTALAQKPADKKIKISGKVFEKGTNLPVEYAPVSFQNVTTKQLFGAMTDGTGSFSFEITPGEYTGAIDVELISYKTITFHIYASPGVFHKKEKLINLSS